MLWEFIIKLKMRYNSNENYCSMSPDGLFGVRFNYGCFLHDRQYRNEVKNRKTRKQTDIDFRKNIQAIYKQKGKGFIGFFVSWIYYFGVRIGGRRAWKN